MSIGRFEVRDYLGGIVVKSAYVAIKLLSISMLIALGFQNCSPVQFVENSLESASQDGLGCIGDASLCPSAISTCTFDGQTYTEGQAITAYLHSTVSSDQTCKSEVRVCKGGSFTGSYLYATCAKAAAASCLFDGKTIAHGGSVKAYQNSSVAFGGSCAEEVRVCNNGKLSGSYSYAACNVAREASCLFDGKTISHGSTVKAYRNSSMAYGQACVSENRLCLNGELSGSYGYSNCSVGAAAGCLFNGQSIPHNGAVIGFESSSVPYGHSCRSQTRTCSNGNLSGSYSFSSCAPGVPESCSWNGQMIAHGQQVLAYASAKVPYGSSCSSQIRTCNNGQLSGSYAFSNCVNSEGASCSLNGQVIPHGGSIYAYPASSVSYGGTCVGQNRICNNGVLSGQYSSTTCFVEQCPSGKTYNSSLGKCVHPSYGQSCNWYGEVTKISVEFANSACNLDNYGGWRGRNFCEYSSRGAGLGTCQCYTDGIYDADGVCYMSPARKSIHGSIYAPYVQRLGITPYYWTYPSWPKAVRP